MSDPLEDLKQLKSRLKLISAKHDGFSQTLFELKIIIGELMSAALDRLTTEVEETKTIMASAVTLIGGLADQIRALKDDPAKLEALATELDMKANELGSAVVSNTPNTPTPPTP